MSFSRTGGGWGFLPAIALLALLALLLPRAGVTQSGDTASTNTTEQQSPPGELQDRGTGLDDRRETLRSRHQALDVADPEVTGWWSNERPPKRRRCLETLTAELRVEVTGTLPEGATYQVRVEHDEQEIVHAVTARDPHTWIFAGLPRGYWRVHCNVTTPDERSFLSLHGERILVLGHPDAIHTFCPLSLRAFEGRLIDGEDHGVHAMLDFRPLPGAEFPQRGRATTGTDGRFEAVLLDEGRYEVIVQTLGEPKSRARVFPEVQVTTDAPVLLDLSRALPLAGPGSAAANRR